MIKNKEKYTGLEEKIEKEREKYIDIACTQVDILNHYDESKKEEWMTKLYGQLRPLMINPSYDKLKKLKNIISEFDNSITNYRKENPKLEEEIIMLKGKLNELERLNP